MIWVLQRIHVSLWIISKFISYFFPISYWSSFAIMEKSLDRSKIFDFFDILVFSLFLLLMGGLLFVFSDVSFEIRGFGDVVDFNLFESDNSLKNNLKLLPLRTLLSLTLYSLTPPLTPFRLIPHTYLTYRISILIRRIWIFRISFRFSFWNFSAFSAFDSEFHPKKVKFKKGEFTELSQFYELYVSRRVD